jgi:hypothetical protein
MSAFRDLIFSERGKIICIMGGSDKLEAELANVKADIYISTNGHGCDLKQAKYVVAMDDRHTKTGEWMREIIRRKTDVPIIGPFPSCDIFLDHWPLMPRRYYSGIVAMWLAHALGAKLIILAGMDGYKADGGFMGKLAKVKNESVPTEVRTTNKTLEEVVPAYDPKEKVKQPAVDARLKTIKAEEGVIEVEVLNSCYVLNIERVVGERVKVNRCDVMIQLKHQMVREL